MQQPLRETVLPPLLAAQIILGVLHEQMTGDDWSRMADARDELSKAIAAIEDLSRLSPNPRGDT